MAVNDRPTLAVAAKQSLAILERNREMQRAAVDRQRGRSHGAAELDLQRRVSVTAHHHIPRHVVDIVQGEKQARLFVFAFQMSPADLAARIRRAEWRSKSVKGNLGASADP